MIKILVYCYLFFVYSFFYIPRSYANSMSCPGSIFAVLATLSVDSIRTNADSLSPTSDTTFNKNHPLVEKNTSDSVSPDLPNQDSIPELSPMTVNEKEQQELLETSQSFTVIKADEWKGSSNNVAEIIQAHSGIQTRKFGGTGSFQTVSIRGVKGRNVLVFLDGIPLNSAMGGAVDLGRIGTHTIETIEIYKGITPARFGGNSMGGVINIKTKSTIQENAVDLLSSFGSFGYLNNAAIVTFAKMKKLKLFSALGHVHCDNDFPYLDRNNTPYNKHDDIRRRVEHHAFDKINTLAKATYDLNLDRSLIAYISHIANTNEIPAEEGFVNRTSQFKEKSFRLQIGYNIDRRKNKQYEINLAGGFMRDDGITKWTGLDNFGHEHGGLINSQYAELSYTNWKLHVSNYWAWLPLSWLRSEAKILASWEDFDPLSSISGSTHGDWHSAAQDLQVAVDVHGHWGKFGCVLGGSGEIIRSKTQGGFDSYYKYTLPPSHDIDYNKSVRIGLNYFPAKNKSIFANLGEYYQLPKLREKYGTKRGAMPNPELKAEQGTNVDGGIKILLDKGFLECIGFYIINRNSIYLKESGRMVKPVNLGKARSFGIECNTNLKLFSHFRLEGHFTLQKTENLMQRYNYSGNRLPNEPDLAVLGKLTIGPFFYFDFQYAMDFKSFLYSDPANIQRIPIDKDKLGIPNHNIRIRWRYQNRLECILSAKNISGNIFSLNNVGQSYETNYTWTLLPGRAFNATICYSFK